MNNVREMGVWGRVWVWGCVWSKRCTSKYDALFGAGFKHAQKKRGPCPLFFIAVSLVNSNSNRKVFSDTTATPGSAISP